MKTRLLVLSLLTATVITGCNHNSSSSIKVKEISGRRGSSEYFYTPDNKISYVVSSTGSKTTFTFSGNKIEQKVVDTLSGRSASSTFYLNGKGLVDSVITTQGPASYASILKHDADGYIVGLDQFASGSLQQSSINNFKDGNKISSIITDSSGTKLATIYFDYYPDKMNSIEYTNPGMKFIGSESKNLQKKIVQLRPAGDTIAAVDFIYRFDDKGRVSQKLVYRGTIQVDSTAYSYY